jgi:hypothetical protein
MDVRIYCPARSATQSGRALRKLWILEFEATSSCEPDFLMGWGQGTEPLSHVRLNFPTVERAITFAKQHGWNYVIYPENFRSVKPFNYIDNFKYSSEQ